jgi:hypothetical protein
MAFRIAITAYPNNEIRVVTSPIKNSPKETYSEPEPESVIVEPEPPLDILLKLATTQNDEKPPDERKSRPGYGSAGVPRKFSTYGRRQILRAGGAIDRTVTSNAECVFFTGTLPGNTKECKVAIAKWSSWAIHRFKTWVNRIVPCQMDLYCWEFQKRGALHLHYVVVVPEASLRSRIIAGAKHQWQLIIDAIGKKEGVDMWRKNAHFTHSNNKEVLQTRAVECEKSVAAYLSKYISKCERQRIDNHWSDCYPNRLWGISRPLLARLKELTRQLTVEVSYRRSLERVREDLLQMLEASSSKSYSYVVADWDSKVMVGYTPNKEELEALWQAMTDQVLQSSCLLKLKREIYTTLIRLSECSKGLTHLLPDGQLSDNLRSFTKLVTRSQVQCIGLSQAIETLDDWNTVLQGISTHQTAQGFQYLGLKTHVKNLRDRLKSSGMLERKEIILPAEDVKNCNGPHGTTVDKWEQLELFVRTAR